MPRDTVDDLREEVSFHVGGVKNTQFLFPTKKPYKFTGSFEPYVELVLYST